jgi:hypothetical protein
MTVTTISDSTAVKNTIKELESENPPELYSNDNPHIIHM